jgi:predicted ATPase/DNA-binding SARP family transcriptional activator
MPTFRAESLGPPLEMAAGSFPVAGMVRIELLGGFRIRCGRRTITRFRTRKTGILLACLACDPHRSHSRERLTDLLWPDANPTAGRHSFSQALSSLRIQIEHSAARSGLVLVADRDTVRLDPSAATIDVQEFRNTLHEARRTADPARQKRLLGRAVELYRGELLPGYYDDWILREREQLEEAYIQALGGLAGIAEAQGDVAGAAALLHRALNVNPLAEALQRRLLRLLARAGQRAAALSAYRHWERLLRAEFEMDPDRRTAQLIRSIMAGDGEASQPGLLEETAGPRKRSVGGVGRASGREHAARGIHPGFQPAVSAPSILHIDFPSNPRSDPSPAPSRTSSSDRSPDPLSVQDRVRLLAQQHGARTAGATGGQGIAFSFVRAEEAVRCAVAIQGDLYLEQGSSGGAELPRMAIHAGEPRAPWRSAAARIAERALHLAGCARPGQILCTEAVSVLARYSLEPGVRLRDMGVLPVGKGRRHEQVYQIEWPGSGQDRGTAPEEATQSARLLPYPVDAFFGRGPELLCLRAWLVDGDVRLVTITGTGGTGKTRLSLEAGRAIASAYSDGACFVPLAAMTSERGVAENLCDALGVRRVRGQAPRDQVLDHLASRNTLLILDNLEHILPAAAQLVQALLSRAPGVRCLCTSRERLRLKGEHVLDLRPLEIPTVLDPAERLENVDSVRLFIDRVQAVRPDFRVTTRNAPAVGRICSSLEGIPLAIELAAARAQVLTPGQMVRRLANRMDFLVSNRAEIEPRHRTLRAALEWSYRLLPRQLKRFLARTVVFRGSWDLEAAEAVTGEPVALDLIEQLRECSLILAEPAGEEMRYRMLETVREFAAEKLPPGDARATGRRHAEHFLRVLRAIRPLMDGPNQKEGVQRLVADQENFNAALEWSLRTAETWPQRTEGRAAARLGLELSVGLALFRWMRGQDREGLDCLTRLLRLPLAGIPPNVIADGSYHAGCSAVNLGEQVLAAECFTRALGIYTTLGDRDGIARAFNMLGNEASDRGDLDAACDYFEKSLALHREAGNERYVAQLLNNMATIAHLRAQYTVARDLFAESLEIKRRVGTPRDVASSLTGLGCSLHSLEDLAGARRCHEEVLRISREIEDERMAAAALTNLATVRCALGEGWEAWRHLCEGLRTYWRCCDRRHVARTLQMMVEDYGIRGSEPLVIEMQGAAERELEALGIAHPPAVQEQLAQRFDRLRAVVGAAAFQSHWEAGRALDLETAVRRALDFRVPESSA